MLQARSLASIAVAVATAVLLPSATLQAQNSSSNSSAANDYRTTLQLYCVGCHSGPTPFAGLNLEPLDFANLEANGEIWEKMIRKLRDTPDAASRHAAAGRCHATRRSSSIVEKRPRSHGGGEAQSGTHHAASAESDGIRQRHSRSVGAGDRRHRSAAGRRYRLRLRQYRRRAVGIAVPAGALSRDGRQGQPRGDRRHHDAGELSDLYGSARAHSARSHRARHCRSARAAAPPFVIASRWTPNTRFRSSCSEVAWKTILGMDKERKLDLRLDDQRLGLFTIAANREARAWHWHRRLTRISRSACR